MKRVYGYIRVSDVKQKDGASLTEQKRIIKEYAQKNKLKIIHFYEENKTAAKKGRPLFDEMMKNLKNEKAEGVIIHKIDRSARNLHDWANIGDLIDMGVDVFFAHESLDLNQRGGRLSADIQAVMASDYVRNLRQEILKGLYGRLKQGFYPWGAPVGYVDNGRAQLKTIDPIQGALVVDLFNLYKNGDSNILKLSKEMERRGLRNQNGNRVCKNGIVRILKNPFYIGIIRIKDKMFKGNHQPLIDRRLFDQVQKILISRNRNCGIKNYHLFRKLIRCQNCNYVMSGELQKGHVYYRCKTKTCDTKCIREDFLEKYVRNVLMTIGLNKSEVEMLHTIISEKSENSVELQLNLKNHYKLKEGQIKNKEEKLLDAYLENVIEKEEYQNRKNDLVFELQQIEEDANSIDASNDKIFNGMHNFVELCKSPLKLYDSGIQEEKRELLETISSNLTIDGKKAIFTMVSPFLELSNRDIFSLCDPNRDTGRILYRQIVYMDKNTSSIIPKPMNKDQINVFYQFLSTCSSTLSKINTLQNQHEIPTNNADS